MTAKGRREAVIAEYIRPPIFVDNRRPYCAVCGVDVTPEENELCRHHSDRDGLHTAGEVHAPVSN